jgi:C4-dicarboxylate transporter DctM subunit
MFIAGFIPGLIVALCLIVANYFVSRKKGYRDENANKFNLKKALVAAWQAKWALLMPIIILGGIYGGVLTPTEAAVVAIVYAVVIGVFVYKELKLKDIWKIFDNNTSFIGGIILTFAPAVALGAVFSLLGFPAMFSSALFSISTNKIVILLVVNLACIIIGMLLDVNSAIIIFGPLFYSALVTNMGMDPIHLGIVLIINFCIGFITPPVAPNLFVASSITGISVTKIAKASLPFLISLFVALMIVTYWEDSVLFLVRLFA